MRSSLSVKFTTLVITLLFFITSINAQNINISNGNVFDGEPYLAINPTNSNNMAIAWMGYLFNNGSGLTIRVKRSNDGGNTWSTPVNLPHMASTYKSADPTLKYDNNGVLHLTYIDYRENPDSGGVFYTRSTNGGASFSTPVKVIDVFADGSKKPIDRPWLDTDASGNNLVVTSLPPSWVSAPNRPYFSGSNNGGLTWKPWRYIDTIGFLVGSLIAQPMPFPAVSGNTVHIVYPSYVPSQNILPQFILASSVNWGNSFTYKSIYAANTSAAQNDSAKSAYKLFSNPANPNHIALLLNAGIGSTDLDVYFMETFNNGNTWSSPLKLNDDGLNNGKMQDLTWGGFNNQGGFAAVWRDRRNAPGIGYAKASEIYGTYRANSTGSFIPNFKISDTMVSYQNILSQNGNDFLSMLLLNDTLHTTWGTTRDGSLDIWYSKHKAGSNLTDLKLVSSETNLLSVFPNPTTGKIIIKSDNNQLILKGQVFNLNGKLMLENNVNAKHLEIDMHALEPGVYQLLIELQGSRKSVKICKE